MSENIKHTIAMLISRSNITTHKVIASVIEDKPDEFLVGLDPKLKDDKDINKLLTRANATIIMQEKSGWLPAVKCWHKLLIDAKHKWVRQCDDDDEIIGSTKKILSNYADNTIGAIHGDVKYSNRANVQKMGNISGVNEIPNFKGSSRIYNKDAIVEIVSHLDLKPWQDYKIVFWMIRYGYKIVNIHEVMSLVHPHDDYPQERINADSWSMTLDILKERATKEGFHKIENPIIDSHSYFVRNKAPSLKYDLTLTFERIAKINGFSGNILIKTGEDNDTIVMCHWHPERLSVFDRWMACIKNNKADILFHMNSNTNRQKSQFIAGLIMEKIAIDNEYKYLWSLHSDILVPPFALEKMKAANVDIISAVVVRPFMHGKRPASAYVAYLMKNNEFGVYNLVKGPNPKNFENRMLPYNKGVKQVAGTGMGCCLFKRDFIKKEGLNTLKGFEFKLCTDTEWCYKILKDGNYKMHVQTEVRCKHLCVPVRCINKRIPEKINFEDENDWIKKDWYGWQE